MIKAICNYIYRLAVSVDQLLNVFLFGDPDETLSSRLSRNAHVWWVTPFYVLVNALFLIFAWQTHHCEKSFIFEYEKREKFHESHEEHYRHLKAILG